MAKEYVKEGHYMCPNCKSGIDIHVPLTSPPVHRCSALKDTDDSAKSKKVFVMERTGEVLESRNRVRRLGTPTEVRAD